MEIKTPQIISFQKQPVCKATRAVRLDALLCAFGKVDAIVNCADHTAG